MFWLALLMKFTLWDLAFTYASSIHTRETTDIKHYVKQRFGAADSIYDYVSYLFVEDDYYYPAVLITDDIVVTFQVDKVYKPMICFKENCASHVRDFWSSDNLHFWQLTAKRPNPSIYQGDLDPTKCYIPSELGKMGFVEFDVIEDNEIECHGLCASGDAIICGIDLYGMLTERTRDKNTFAFLSVVTLRKMSSRPTDTSEDDNSILNALVPTELQLPEPTPMKSDEHVGERRESLAAQTRSSFNLPAVFLYLSLVCYCYG